MREQDALRDFYFNRNKFCSIIISLIFFIFSNHVYGESVKDIICVGPTNAGDTASEAGTNPCNLSALQANAAVDRIDVISYKYILSSSEEEEGEAEQSQPKADGEIGAVR